MWRDLAAVATSIGVAIVSVLGSHAATAEDATQCLRLPFPDAGESFSVALVWADAPFPDGQRRTVALTRIDNLVYAIPAEAFSFGGIPSEVPAVERISADQIPNQSIATTLDGIAATDVTPAGALPGNLVASWDLPAAQKVVLGGKDVLGTWASVDEGFAFMAAITLDAPDHLVSAIPSNGLYWAIPSNALPASAIPSNAIPSNALPASALPASALPSSALPASAIPSNAIPSNAIPSNALPASALPASALPSSVLAEAGHFALAAVTVGDDSIAGTWAYDDGWVLAIPSNGLSAIPAEAFEDATFPSDGLSAIPKEALPASMIEARAIPSNAIPSNAIPSNAIPSNAIPSNALGAAALPSSLVSLALPTAPDARALLQLADMAAGTVGVDGYLSANLPGALPASALPASGLPETLLGPSHLSGVGSLDHTAQLAGATEFSPAFFITSPATRVPDDETPSACSPLESFYAETASSGGVVMDADGTLVAAHTTRWTVLTPAPRILSGSVMGAPIADAPSPTDTPGDTTGSTPEPPPPNTPTDTPGDATGPTPEPPPPDTPTDTPGDTTGSTPEPPPPDTPTDTPDPGQEFGEDLDKDDDGHLVTPHGGDCDDSDPAINPDATDTPDDGVDQDCSGADATNPTGPHVVYRISAFEPYKFVWEIEESWVFNGTEQCDGPFVAEVDLYIEKLIDGAYVEATASTISSAWMSYRVGPYLEGQEMSFYSSGWDLWVGTIGPLGPDAVSSDSSFTVSVDIVWEDGSSASDSFTMSVRNCDAAGEG